MAATGMERNHKREKNQAFPLQRMSSFASIDLVSHSSLTASSTDTNGKNCFGVGCSIDNVRQTAPDDESNHLTNWKSAPDSSCPTVIVTADWSGFNSGSFSLSSMSVLFDAQDGKTPSRGSHANGLTLNYASGASMDVSNWLLCTRAQVDDDGNIVAWDICAFDSAAPDGTFDRVQGAIWKLTPVKGKNNDCQVGVYEMQMHGVETKGAVICVGAIVGIVIAILVAISIAAACVIRRSNLRKRKARGLQQPTGGWQSLELWAADRADHHDT
ncbi:hypothetical protein BC830DRAFT_1081488 [Chytriomyces sp. MP71]|nr:hypothetical protein BC830DRAFT_1081488 [Chytriomyces sp. MP71]